MQTELSKMLSEIKSATTEHKWRHKLMWTRASWPSCPREPQKVSPWKPKQTRTGNEKLGIVHGFISSLPTTSPCWDAEDVAKRHDLKECQGNCSSAKKRYRLMVIGWNNSTCEQWIRWDMALDAEKMKTSKEDKSKSWSAMKRWSWIRRLSAVEKTD